MNFRWILCSTVCYQWLHLGINVWNLPVFCPLLSLLDSTVLSLHPSLPYPPLYLFWRMLLKSGVPSLVLIFHFSVIWLWSQMATFLFISKRAHKIQSKVIILVMIMEPLRKNLRIQWCAENLDVLLFPDLKVTRCLFILISMPYEKILSSVRVRT